MKNIYFFVLGLTLLTLGTTPSRVNADEVWSTEESDVVYQEDRNTTAIWTYGNGTIFIQGLGGVVSDRGSYHGYWVQESSSMRCDTYREGADGKPNYHWGRFAITFIDADFPSRWQAKFSLCDYEPTRILNGTPLSR